MSQAHRLPQIHVERLEPRRLFSVTAGTGIGIVVGVPVSPDPSSGGTVVVDQPASVQMHATPGILTSSVTSFSGAVANFAGPPPADQYTATIDWGDGTTSPGEIQLQQDGSYTVIGSHDFGVKGSFNVSVEVDATDGSTGYVFHTIYTDAGALVMTTDPSIWATTGDAVDQVYVASFFDQNPPSDPSAYTITIDWGDGTTSAGQATTSDGQTFDVYATHGYTSAGNYNINLTVTRPAAGSDTTSPSITDSGTAQVDDPLPASVQMNPTPSILTSPDTSFSGAVANFTGPLSADQYTATIDWGDGTTSSGDIQLQQDGSYAVVGSHHFGVKGSFSVSVEVDAADGSTGYDSHAIYTDAGSMVMTSNPSIWTTTGNARDQVHVASFFDQNPATDPSVYTITIDWGDGTTSAGQATTSDGETFDIYATHSYPSAGNYNVNVTVTRPAAGSETSDPSITDSGTAEVDDPTPVQGPVPIGDPRVPPFGPVVLTDLPQAPVDTVPTLMLEGVAVTAPTTNAPAAGAPSATASESSAGAGEAAPTDTTAVSTTAELAPQSSENNPSSTSQAVDSLPAKAAPRVPVSPVAPQAQVAAEPILQLTQLADNSTPAGELFPPDQKTKELLDRAG
jgi:hypothetical protein